MKKLNITIIVLLYIGIASIAYAHKVMIFAWIEKDIVHTESKFGGGKKVKNAQITVYDLNDTLLVQGKTDDNGLYSFSIPNNKALKIVLYAGMGHQAQWILNENEIANSIKQQIDKQLVEQSNEQFKNDQFKEKKLVNRSKKGLLLNKETLIISSYQLETIIDKALDKKLNPVIKLITTMDTTSIKDIMASIGYIFGLVGVAAYFHNRKK